VIKHLSPEKKLALKRTFRIATNWSVAWLAYAIARRLGGLMRALHAGVQANWIGHGALFNFRRGIHRLEKGLSFPDRRAVFAEDYIGETVDLFRSGWDDPAFDGETLRWGQAVLARYFDTVDHTPAIARAFESYRRAKPGPSDLSRSPYQACVRPASNITFEELFNLAKRRRSVRFYEDRPVPEELVRRALQVGAQAPSACNRQAFQYLYFTERDVVDALSEVPGGIAGYRVPALIIVIGKYRGYFDERDVKAPIIDASLSVMGFLLALETLGLSSVCINWPNHPKRERELRRHIELESDEFVVMMIGLGYAAPTGLIPFSAKRPDRDLFVVNDRLRAR
jgi:nitroreductase